MIKAEGIVKVAGYIRVSSPDQARGGVSLKVQEDAIRRYASIHNYAVIKIYRDEGISGAKKSRLGLENLRMDARDGNFDKVIFKRLARFGRNAMDLLSLYKEFEDSYQIELVSIDEGIKTTTSIGRLLRSVLAAIAEFERDTINIRMIEARCMKLRNFEIYNGKVPYGYKFDKNRRKIIINPKEKAVYLKVVDLYLNHDMSLAQICQHLNKLGVKTKERKRWCDTSLGYIIRNEAYMGKKVLHKYKYKREGSNSKRVTIKDGHKTYPVLKPKSSWIVYPFPKFIDESVWNQVQRKLKLRIRKTRTLRYPDKFFVASLIRCGNCGGRMGGATSNSGKNCKRPHHYYQCYWSKSYLRDRYVYHREECTMSSIKMEFVDDFIWSKIASILSSPDKPFLEFITNNEIKKSLIEDMNGKKVELKNLESKIDRYLEEVGNVSDSFVRASMVKKTNLLGRKTSELRSTIDVTEKQLDTIVKTQITAEGFDYLNFRFPLMDCIASIPFNEKKHIIRTLIPPEDCDRAPVILHHMPLGDKPNMCKQAGDGSNMNDDNSQGRGILIDLYFNLRMDNVLRVFEYLKHKGYLDNDKILNGINAIKFNNILVPVRETRHVLRPLIKTRSRKAK